MKKLTLIILLFVSLVSFAQNKFIEVEVTDTISLKPLNFQCNVYVDNDGGFVIGADEDFDPQAAEEETKNKLQEVKRMLESKKYKVGPLDESKLNIMERKRAKTNGFTVTISGESEMQKLKDMLDSADDVVTVVTVLKYAEELKAEEQLIKKLIDKAKARATVIGVSSGLKVGRILEVKEGKHSEEFNMNDFYSQIVKMGNFGQDTGNYTGSLSKTFVVKFAAE